MSGHTTENRYCRYLLGELPEPERDAFEEEYFSSDEGFQELQAAEDDLFDAYAAGGLPPDRRARFEERYLRSHEDRERIQYTRLLQAAAERARPRWQAAPGAAGSLARLRAEAERLAELVPPVREGARLVSLILRTRVKRDVAPVPQLTLSPAVTVVRLTLRLREDAGTPPRVSLQTPEGREVWGRSGLRPVASDEGLAIVVDVPAARLASGHYVAVVSNQAGAALADYVFQVVRT